MKSVTIYAFGSCNWETREGTAHVLLEYNSIGKQLQFPLQDTTANRCIIEGLLAGVRMLKEPCAVRLVTSTPIGVESALRGKGANGALVRALIADLESRSCRVEFDVWEGRGDELRERVLMGRPRSAGVAA